MTTMTADQAAAELVQAIDEHRRKPLPLGLHFDLDFTSYLSDIGLGSGDIKQLAEDPEEYQNGSWMNPLRVVDEKDTKAQKYGKAFHKCVLEGREWFDAHYVCGPDQSGMTSGEKSTSTRKANEAAAALRKESLSEPDYRRIVTAAARIMMNPDLSVAFSGGAPEVSFFWMEDGVRMKMRADYLKVRHVGGKFHMGIGDIKTMGRDWRTKDPEQMAHNAIDDYNYHVQAVHYLAGASRIQAAVAEGLVHFHGPNRFEALLERIPKSVNAIGWSWVFQKSSGAPKTVPLKFSPSNPLYAEGIGIRNRGIEHYKNWMQQKGPHELWAEQISIREVELERMRRR